MIITLKGATFSNYLDLNSWMVISDLVGVTSSNTETKVTKGQAYTTTFTINEGYTLNASNVSVICNGATQTLNWSSMEAGGTATLTVTPTSTIYITIRATSTSGSGSGSGSGEEEQPEPENPTPDVGGDYVSYQGTSAFTDAGQRVQWNGTKWVDTHSGTTSAGTDLIPVSSEDSIWISTIAVVNNTLASGGFYDASKNLVAPLNWDTFGMDQETAKAEGGNFVPPAAPVTIASVEAANNCEIAYVKFTAWSASASESTGIENTEARVYYANGVPQEPSYVSYVGEDVFTFNKETFTDAGYTTTGSSSAYSTDYIEVTPEQGIWLQYIFTMSDAHRCVGLFDSSKTFIKSVTMADFGLEQGDKFKTPAAPVKISSISDTENVAYVRFVAWTTSNGGVANTEARIYSY